MSVDRQFGVHELPGTEQPAPSPAKTKTTVSAGFELQTRGYINAMWAKIVELEGRIERLSSSQPPAPPRSPRRKKEGAP